jgi:hypothetical protein
MTNYSRGDKFPLLNVMSGYARHRTIHYLGYQGGIAALYLATLRNPIQRILLRTDRRLHLR